jgi:hypothetical protein
MAKATKAKLYAPGAKLAEGIVITHDDRGVLLGREAEPGETCPARHSEHQLGARRVFLSHDQAPIQAKYLHQAGK